MAVASSLYAAGLFLVMLFSMQAMVRIDLRPDLGTVGAYLTKTLCYALSVVFLVGVVVEAGRLVAAV
jgi:hypothetical protein